MRDLIDLASERLGGSVLYANDDFFAEKENLLKPSKAIWKEHEYTDRGKWMDGWESRRKRVVGHDFAIIRLGLPGVVHGVVVDTAFFRGNYPESCSIEGTSMRVDASVEELLAAEWRELLPRSPLQGDSENEFAVARNDAVTHLRFNIFPDGGVARLRVYGEVVPDWRIAGGLGNEIDLAAAENGADVLTCSDMFFGPKHNLIMPGRAHNMSDGWETRRRRGPGHDWVIVKLATEGHVRRVEIDTNHFKGNYPDTASLEGSRPGENNAASWTELLPRTKLQAHTRHFFIDELTSDGPFTHLRMNVYPDGGVSRLRVWGRATIEGRRAAAVRRVNTLFHPQVLRAVCASTAWIDAMIAARPFASWDQMIETSNRIWFSLPASEHLEAFAAHPRIGERKPGWSSHEQSGTASASQETMAAIAAGNVAYEQKHGFVFLVCATGRGADEMRANLEQRLQNDRETELRIAAEEHAKITALRLEKLVL
ncbi:MAG TPA: allantoicase [Thermoanaerobaculia bacterium]|nr:allantoicase [Thermoanaerobaculia bacterium]